MPLDSRRSLYAVLASVAGLLALYFAVALRDYPSKIWALVLFLEAFVYAYCIFPLDRDCNILDHRLDGYALLKLSEPKGDAERRLVTAFEVLLGAAKKVETKAASLLTVWVLAAGGVLTVMASAGSGDRRCYVGGLLAICPVLLALVRIFRQLDNVDAVSDSLTPDDLFFDLAKDLLMKEAHFRFAYRISQIAIVSLFAVLAYRMYLAN